MIKFYGIVATPSYKVIPTKGQILDELRVKYYNIFPLK